MDTTTPADTKESVLVPGVNPVVDNILLDSEQYLRDLETLDVELKEQGENVQEPSAADNFISLINNWNKDESVINITPQSIRSVANNIRIGDSNSKNVRFVDDYLSDNQRSDNQRSDNQYSSGKDYTSSNKHISKSRGIWKSEDSDSDSTLEETIAIDIEEKVDATYNKLCSVEIANTEAINEVQKINGQLENINRHSVMNSKFNRTVEERLNIVSNDIANLSVHVCRIDKDIKEIKSLLTKIVKLSPVINL